MSSSIATVVKASVVLDSPKDWDEWFFLVKTRAKVLKIWDLVDPDLSQCPTQLIKPILPRPSLINENSNTFATLTSDEREFLKFLLLEYKSNITDYEQKTSALAELMNFILGSISRHYITFVMDSQTVYDVLIELKKRLAPTDRAREIELSRLYQQLKKPPRTQNLDKWLQQWEKTYKDAIRIELPEVQQNRALFDFLLATKTIDVGFASTNEVLLTQSLKQKGTLPSLFDLIEDFRNHIRLMQASNTRSHNVFATFQGNSTQSDEFKPPFDCVCGERHLFKQCFYLNEHLRPSTWVLDQETQRKIDEKLKKSEKLRAAIQRSCKGNLKDKILRSQKDQEKEKVDEKKILGSFACYSSHVIETFLTYKLQDSWILDSGSDIHVCNNLSRFTQTHPATSSDIIYAGKTHYQIEAFGTCNILVKTPAGIATITLLNVALVTGFLTNLVSLTRFMDKGVHWDTEGKRLHIQGKTLCFIERFDEHWILEHNNFSANHQVLATQRSRQPLSTMKKTSEEWHQALGHPSHEVLQHLVENVSGVMMINGNQNSTLTCESCSLSKAHQLISRQNIRENPESEPFERIAFDLIQMTHAYNDDQWISHFYCYKSHANFIFTHRRKTEVAELVIEFITMVERRFNKRIRYFRTDGETSLGNTFNDFMGSKGIIIERSAPYTPAQNGAAERSGGVILTKARTMRICAGLPTNLWPEIMMAAGYILNRTPVKQLEWKTPFEIIMGCKPSLSHLRIYGCRAYPLRYDLQRTEKLEPRAHIGYLTGYDSRNIFRVWVPSLKRIIRTRDVTFNENLFYNPTDLDLGYALQEGIEDIMIILDPDLPFSSRLSLEFLEDFSTTDTLITNTKEQAPIVLQSYLPSPTPSNRTNSTIIVDLETIAASSSSSLLQEALSETSSIISLEEVAPRAIEISSILSTDNILPDGSKRTRRHAYMTALAEISTLSGFYSAFSAALQPNEQNYNKKFHRDTIPKEPRTWKQMLSHQFTLEFQNAARLEYKTLQKKGTFKTVQLSDLSPSIQKEILPLLWVFRYKFDTDGFVTKFKARLCVRGDLQIIDRDVYTATLTIRTFRALMAITAAFDLECKQYDAVNAFINSTLDDDVFCEYPDGFQQEGYCLKLLRALYGLKQSPLLWYHELTGTLENLGLEPVPGVNCLFSNEWLLIFFYVDDIVAIFSLCNLQKFINFESRLFKQYEMRCLGDLEWFLGIRVIRNRNKRKLFLCQDSYISKIVTKFHLENKKPAKTPLSSEELTPYDRKATNQEVFAYQQRIGSINFAAVTTRPDISFAVSRLSEFLKNPSPLHMIAADRVLTYLYGTKGLAIEYDGKCIRNGMVFNCASDASFADDPLTRKSSEGYIFSLFDGPVDWRASKQRSVTTSSTEAELLSLSQAAREVIWWKRFFISIKFDTGEATTIHCDNLQTVRLLTNEIPKLETKLRHVDVHQHWLRQEVIRKTLKINWISTLEMPADGLTKALSIQKHRDFLTHLHLVDLAENLEKSVLDSKKNSSKSEGVCETEKDS